MIITDEILTDIQVGGAIEEDELVDKILNILSPGPSLEAMVVGLKAVDKALEPRRQEDGQVRPERGLREVRPN